MKVRWAAPLLAGACALLLTPSWIDLATVTDAELAGSVLENLARHAEAKVTLWSLAGG